MFTQLGFLFDPNKCIGCKACESACRNENATSGLVKWRKVRSISIKYNLSVACNHCSSPECFRVCPNQAYVKKRNGVVLIDQNKCDGCRTCIPACPFGANQFNPETNKVSKCQLCYKRLKKGLMPACVDACPTNALTLIDYNNHQYITTVKQIPDFENLLTKPSTRFVPLKNKAKSYWRNI